jgi:large subunit ribosomal protein L4
MKLTVKDIKGNDQGQLDVKFALVEDGHGTQAVHDVVVAHQAAQRMGTACTKTMGDVRGTGKKPWRQKGTGRARAGSFASPLWRGGGVTFGPKPRDFGKKVNRKTRQLALRKSLSERLAAGEVLVVSDINLTSAKTKEFLAVLKALQITGTTLIVANEEKNLLLASRNVPGVEITTGEALNTYQILRYDRIVFTRAGLEAVEQRLQSE